MKGEIAGSSLARTRPATTLAFFYFKSLRSPVCDSFESLFLTWMQHNFQFSGLTEEEVITSRKKHGTNVGEKPAGRFWPAIKDILTEPMFLLLIATAIVYSLLGQTDEAIFMAIALLLVSGISFFQEHRSKKALDTLKTYTHPLATVLREGKLKPVPAEEIVVGDFVVVEEGNLIPADGIIRQSNDFTVNESILTGESFTVSKEGESSSDRLVYQGTLVSSGLALIEVVAIGTATRLGQIGTSIQKIREERTPLQRQIHTFVRRMAVIGVAVFLLIWVYSYVLSRDVLDSLLKGLTLAMSILPEEIPVAFTTFMALGAWRLMQQGVIVKQIKTVETLGSATVICLDKTGTITENKMALKLIYLHRLGQTVGPGEWDTPEGKRVIELAMWASEPAPFDPMEKALHEAYATTTPNDRRPGAAMIHEYPLGGKPPMMTHVFRTEDGEEIVAAKGAPEAILRVSTLSPEAQASVDSESQRLARDGYRVLGVARADVKGPVYPREQEEIKFDFLGLVAFYDPPKQNITDVISSLYQAGIKVKIITGDNKHTAIAIAKRIGLQKPETAADGSDINAMDDGTLQRTINQANIFARMFPDVKLRVINTLKAMGEIVAMTGDGVNDGPALKAAHIGIAMGKRGTELAKQASPMVLVEDDLAKMVDALAMGRKIYSNLKKAIQYIISIHIPIILTVSLPLFLGWIYPDIFTPVHVIFLELIMGPTCSIVYENEPIEKRSMQQPPRTLSTGFLSWRELRISIIQGLAITAGTLGSYQLAIHHGLNEESTRSMVFVSLIVANIFLTLTNRSFFYSLWHALSYKNTLMVVVVLITVVLLVLIVYTPQLNNFFKLQQLEVKLFVTASLIGIASVVWIEVYKAVRRIRAKNGVVQFI